MIAQYPRRSPSSFLALLVCLLFWVSGASSIGASDWPHWRGPDHNGYSEEKGLPAHWSVAMDGSRNIIWKLPLPGVSGSTPIIVGDLVFLNVGSEDSLELWAVDRTEGTILWERTIGLGNHTTRKQNMSSPSPVTDGERVWVLTGNGQVKGFDLEGKELWSRDLQNDYGQFGLNWGYGSSPLYDGGRLFIQVLHGMKTDDPSYVLALDPATGKNLWRVERPTDARMESPDSYTTPAILRRQGGDELIVTGGDYVTGHDVATGKEIWRLAGLNPDKEAMYRIVASPVVVGSMIYVPSRVSPLLALRAGESGAPQIVWSIERGTDVPTPATDGKSFFLVNDRGILRRFDAQSGREVWAPERLRQGVYSSSPVVADGKLFVTNESGVTSVVSTGDEFEVLAENDLDGYTLSSIAIADGKLFLRNDRFLYCIGEIPEG